MAAPWGAPSRSKNKKSSAAQVLTEQSFEASQSNYLHHVVGFQINFLFFAWSSFNREERTLDRLQPVRVHSFQGEKPSATRSKLVSQH